MTALAQHEYEFGDEEWEPTVTVSECSRCAHDFLSGELEELETARGIRSHCPHCALDFAAEVLSKYTRNDPRNGEVQEVVEAFRALDWAHRQLRARFASTFRLHELMREVRHE